MKSSRRSRPTTSRGHGLAGFRLARPADGHLAYPARVALVGAVANVAVESETQVTSAGDSGCLCPLAERHQHYFVPAIAAVQIAPIP